jgi:SPP1 family predicted phage head-tail adaptor
MRSGKLRHRVVIKKPVETQNTFGEPEVRWQDFATVWAAIEPLRGREYFAAKQINAEVEANVTIRYLEGMSAKMKIIHDQTCTCRTAVTDEYLIESIISPRACTRSLELMCKRFSE